MALVAGPRASHAGAGDWATSVEPATPWREISVGGSFTPSSWSLYSTSTFAPFGGLNSDGIRGRLGSGYGQYKYTVPERFHYTCPKPSHICPAMPVRGRVSFGDVLAGYQFGYGRFTAKAFAGLAIDTQALTPWDANNEGAGRASGFKAVVETWTNITPAIWLSLDGSWTTAHEGQSIQARLGYRLLPGLSVGIEEGKVRNAAGHQFRSGLFARYEWSGGEASLSGGINGQHHDYPETSKDRTWAAISVMFRY
ncbi:MAG: cellulose biosynthesis protein BcsS, partial [Hyphomicrobiaceae bacterium]